MIQRVLKLFGAVLATALLLVLVTATAATSAPSSTASAVQTEASSNKKILKVRSNTAAVVIAHRTRNADICTIEFISDSWPDETPGEVFLSKHKTWIHQVDAKGKIIGYRYTNDESIFQPTSVPRSGQAVACIVSADFPWDGVAKKSTKVYFPRSSRPGR